MKEAGERFKEEVEHIKASAEVFQGELQQKEEEHDRVSISLFWVFCFSNQDCYFLPAALLVAAGKQGVAQHSLRAARGRGWAFT